MNLLAWSMILLAVGLALLVLELFLPTHGLLGVAAVLALLASVFLAFNAVPWVGIAILVGLMAATPVAWTIALRVWPKTPIGRRVFLPPVSSELPPPQVQIGQSGLTVSVFNPAGVFDVDGKRVSAVSRSGIIPAGAAVRIVALDHRTPVVEAIPTPTNSLSEQHT